MAGIQVTSFKIAGGHASAIGMRNAKGGLGGGGSLIPRENFQSSGDQWVSLDLSENAQNLSMGGDIVQDLGLRLELGLGL